MDHISTQALVTCRRNLRCAAALGLDVQNVLDLLERIIIAKIMETELDNSVCAEFEELYENAGKAYKIAKQDNPERALEIEQTIPTGSAAVPRQKLPSPPVSRHHAPHNQYSQYPQYPVYSHIC
jgi:hypothetical protein